MRSAADRCTSCLSNKIAPAMICKLTFARKKSCLARAWQDSLSPARRSIDRRKIPQIIVLPRIPFNRPLITGRELSRLQEAVARRGLSGDGHFSKQCEAWLVERLGTKRAAASGISNELASSRD
jgi:hypothetical protein